MYIDRAERAWKNDTNPPVHEKVKYILKILSSCAPTRYWLDAHSRCPKTILGWYTTDALYIGGAGGVQKNNTNPLVHRKVKCVLKKNKQFCTHLQLAGGTLKMSRNYFRMLYLANKIQFGSHSNTEIKMS